MENQTAKTEFKTSTGANVVVTAELILKETHYADGDNIAVDCCEMGIVTAKIDGHPDQFGYHKLHKTIDHKAGKIVATIGNLSLIEKNNSLVEAIIDKLKQHPVWIAKQAQIEKNQKEIAKMEAARDSSPGYCRKCGSYCYGDCEAN